jgi:hypothetical protein
LQTPSSTRDLTLPPRAGDGVANPVQHRQRDVLVPTLRAHRYTQVYFGRDVQDKSFELPRHLLLFQILKYLCIRKCAERGNACLDAPRRCRTRSVHEGIPTLRAHRYTQIYFGRDAQTKVWTPESKIYFGRDAQTEVWTPESKIYFGRDAQTKVWTPESKIYFGRLDS